MIAESITANIATVKLFEQKTEADREAKAELARKVEKTDKAAQDLLQNLNIMQQNLAAAVSRRGIDKEFSVKYMVPTNAVQAPMTHTPAFTR